MSDQSQANRQRNKGDAGRALKILCTEKGDKQRLRPPTASELKAVPTLRKRSGEEKFGGKRRVVDSLAIDEKEKA